MKVTREVKKLETALQCDRCSEEKPGIVTIPYPDSTTHEVHIQEMHLCHECINLTHRELYTARNTALRKVDIFSENVLVYLTYMGQERVSEFKLQELWETEMTLKQFILRKSRKD